MSCWISTKGKYQNNLKSKRRREGEGGQNLFEKIIAKNFSNLGKDLDIEVPNNRPPYYFNEKKTSRTHYNETVNNKR